MSVAWAKKKKKIKFNDKLKVNNCSPLRYTSTVPGHNIRLSEILNRFQISVPATFGAIFIFNKIDNNSIIL